MTWQVYVRGADRRTVGPALAAWESLTLVQRRNDVGTWLLELPTTLDWQLFQPGCGVIIRRDNTTIASGFLWTPQEREQMGIEDHGLVGGWDDTVLLNDTLCWPQPTQPIGSQTATPYATALDTPASDRVRSLFQANAITRQQIPGAAVEPPAGLGKAGRSLTAMTNLLEHAREICAQDVNFWVRQRDADQALVLQFRAPRDLRATTRFSPKVGNVSGWKISDSGPEVQEVILRAGEGEQTVFRRRTATDAGLIGSRVSDWGGVRKIEKLIDEPGMNPADTLFIDEAREKMDAELIAGRSRSSFQVDIDGSMPFRGPIDQGGFDIGDLARAYATDTEYVDDLIEQVEITVTAEQGERTQVWVGPVDDPDERKAASENRLRRQVQRLMRAL